MDYNYFTKTIQKRGKQYFDQNRVFSIDGKNNKYSALVLGNEPYHVILTLDSNHNIKKASCSCPYAKDGYHCKHEAALYYALEERLLENNIQFLDVKQLYKKYSRQTMNDYMLNYKFMNDFKNYINTITSLYKRNLLDIRNYQRVLNDLVQLTYPKGYKNNLYNKAFHTYTKFVKNKEEETIEWLKESFVSRNYHKYRKYLIEILNLFTPLQQVDVLKYVLVKHKDEELLEWYLEIVEKNNLDIGNCLNGLEAYSYHEGYCYCLCVDLFKKGKKAEAYQRYRQYIKKGIIKDKAYLAKLKSILVEGEENAYLQYVLEFVKYSEYEGRLYWYEDLERFYGDKWYRYKEQLISVLRDYCDTYEFYHLLASRDDIKTMICELIDSPIFEIFRAYQNKIMEFDQESYIYLYVICLLDEVQYIKNSKDYHHFRYYIQCLFDYVDDQLIKHEIAQLFIRKYPKRKKVKEIIDQYLNLEGEEYEYKY